MEKNNPNNINPEKNPKKYPDFFRIFYMDVDIVFSLKRNLFDKKVTIVSSKCISLGIVYTKDLPTL